MTTASLEHYAALVRHYSERLDLVAPNDLARLEERHIADSLKALDSVDSAPEGLCIDVGSGAGFPGVPLALARPRRSWRLLEPRTKRAAFLEEVVRALELDAEVLCMTAERAARDPLLAGVHAVATARALAPPASSFGWMAPLVTTDGIRIVWAGRRAALSPGAERLPNGLAIMRREGA